MKKTPTTNHQAPSTRHQALRTTLALLATALPVALSAAIPQRWTVETSRLQPAQFEAYHGETIEFAATMQTYGKPLAITNDLIGIYWQTNGMGSVYWTAQAVLSNNVMIARFTPEMDVGANVYSCFIGAPGEIYRAAFQLRLRPSPGAVPSELPLPVKTLDFAQVQVLNAPYYSKSETDAKIIELAPAPGNYATVSNRAMTAVQPSAISDMETQTHATATFATKTDLATLSDTVDTMSDSIDSLSDAVDSKLDKADVIKQSAVTSETPDGKAADAKDLKDQLAKKVDEYAPSFSAVTYDGVTYTDWALVDGPRITLKVDVSGVLTAAAQFNASTGIFISGAALFDGVAGVSGVSPTLRDKVARDSALDGKQDTISDLASIRSGAALGSTALQSYTETDPTVPSWAKATTKPTYSGSEIPLTGVPGGTVQGFAEQANTMLASMPSTSTPILSLNAGNIASGAGSTVLSELYISGEKVATENVIEAHDESETAHADIRNELVGKLDKSGGTMTGNLAINNSFNSAVTVGGNEFGASGSSALRVGGITDYSQGGENILDFPDRSGTFALTSDITAAIDHTSIHFSNEVLAVGLNIDTNSVAQINAILDDLGGVPIVGTATTVGGLLLALAAAVAWLKKNALRKGLKTDGTPDDPNVSALFTIDNSALMGVVRYAFNSDGTIKDRAINAITYAGGALPNFPAQVSRYARDFLLNVTATATASDISLPESGATSVGDALAFEASHSYLVAVTEIAAKHYYIRIIDTTPQNAA